MQDNFVKTVVTACDGSDKSIKEAVNQLLAEDLVFSVGDTVASVDDDTAVGGFVGKGRITGFSENKQWAKVALPGGTEALIQTSLLYRAAA